MTATPGPGFRRALGLVFAVLLALPVAAGALTEDQERRYQKLTEQLRCLVCQNQSIAESNADLAEDLRAQVKTQIEAGRSDEDILAYMADRYGDFVLYRPPLKYKTLLLWVGPFLILLAALGVVWRVVRRAPRTPAPPPDETRLRTLLDEAAPPERREP